MIKKIRLFFLLLILNILWSAFVPGLVAYLDHVFYSKDIPSKIKHSLLASKVNAHLKSQSLIKAKVDSITQVIINDPSLDTNKLMLFNLKEEYENLYEKGKNNFRISGYYNAKVNYVYLVTYLSLTLLILFNRIPKRINFKRVLVSALILHLIYDWTNVFRNFVFNVEERSIFSYANVDISPMSFVLQELRIFFILFMLSIVLDSWLTDLHRKYKTINYNTNIHDIGYISNSVSRSFFYWQVNTILLACTFIPFTWFYWSNITLNKDLRYVYSAIFIHIIWLISWILASIDFSYSVIKWQKFKLKVLSDFMKNGNYKSITEVNPILEGANPLSQSQLVTGGVISFASFAIPFLNLFR